MIVASLCFHLHRRPYESTYLNNVDTATLSAAFVRLLLACLVAVPLFMLLPLAYAFDNLSESLCR